MGKKCIIELEDKPFNKGNGDFLYRVKGFNSLVFDMTGVGKLTPYTEPDLDAIRNETWEAARKIWEYDITTLKAIFGNVAMRMDCYTKFTAAEAIEKIRAYEQAQKEKEEQEKEKSITAEEVMRQYLDAFCKSHSCPTCLLHTSEFTCGRGYHFTTKNPISNEEVRRAYAEVMRR